jgi:arylsulfatase A-like enzyme
MKTSLRNPLRPILDAAALGILLTLADAALHADASYWLAHPISTLRAFSWIAALYVAGVLVLTAALRRRLWVVLTAVSGFVFAQGALALHRGSFGDIPLPLRLGLLAVVSLGLGWGASRLQKARPITARASLAIVGGAVVLAALIPLFWPSSEAATGPAWPSPTVASEATETRPNVLLITLDTTRPDRLSAYGYEAIETPHLDSLAAGGALFLHGVSQAPNTPVSHASILSGMFPAKHGLHRFTMGTLSSEYPLLAELLKEAGYITGALIASAVLSPVYSFDRGFDVYQLESDLDSLRSGPFWHAFAPSLLRRLGLVRVYAYRPGSLQADDAIRWIRRYSERPFFLWVHFFDPHDPYNLHPEFGRAKYHRGASAFSRFKRPYRYDSEVLGVDHEVGRIVRELRALDLLDETIVAVISDHGEGLGDHGYFLHDARLFQEQIRLVLLLHYPAVISAGLKVTSQVRSVDLMPTLLDLAGLEAPDGLDGANLLDLLAHDSPDNEPAHRIAFAETHAHGLLAVMDGRFKLIRSPSGKEWLFDLQRDPGETQNLAGSMPGVEEDLRSLLDAYDALVQSGGSQRRQLDEDLIRQLRALGYIN